MKNLIFEIISNRKIAKNTYECVLSGDITDIKCGQFVNITIDGQYLRRPISVCDAEDGKLTLIYKVVGVPLDTLQQQSSRQYQIL